MTRILLFNWPKYAACAVAIALVLAVRLDNPAWFAIQLLAGGGAAWVVAGLLMTWFAYDVAPLYDWRWVLRLLPAKPRSYAVVSAGLDEISGQLAQLLPDAQATLFDVYAHTKRRGSIRRARRLVQPPAGLVSVSPTAFPATDASFDAVFMVLAAHELRAARDRDALYGEAARTLRSGGRLVLVEHFRGLANILAYGPGAWHFLPRTEWLRLGRQAGLSVTAETTMTPLVRALAYAR